MLRVASSLRLLGRAIQTTAIAADSTPEFREKEAPTKKEIDELFKTDETKRGMRMEPVNNINRVEFVGNVPMDPDVKTFSNGKETIRFSIITRKNANDGAPVRHTLNAFGDLGNFVKENIKKGQKVHCLAHLHYTTIEGQGDGRKKRIMHIVADVMLRNVGLLTRTAIRGLATDAQSSMSSIESPLGRQSNPPKFKAFSKNHVELIGGVSQDPVLRKAKNGMDYTILQMVTTYGEAVEFHNVMVYGKLVGIVMDNTKKGDRVYVTGALRSYTPQTEDGAKKNRVVQVHATTVSHFIKNSGKNSDEERAAESEPY
ncbi:unnamed protein product, partial [Mesorhabditis belari]|uniref:Single-stranded DNA-binding protein n=1 Tax=Mesorhabditis belari TaxID=2138241 RepID=A0AAF3J1M6_9BILA